MLGLPGTGKTTYMGALWHMAEEPSVMDIRETSLPVNPRHIQKIAGKVRAIEEIQRTNHDDDGYYQGTIEFPDHGAVALRMHDRSGEQLQALVERRHWPELLAGEVAEANALLLFLSDDQLILPLSLRLAEGLSEGDPAKPAADALNRPVGVSNASDSATQDDQASPAGYAHHYASTAAQLIDAMENILEKMDDRWPVRVAVVIAKFDRVQGRTPREWLRERVPALEAFLDNNPSRVAWETFGVCALGGAPEDRAELLEDDLHERAWARNANGDSVPLSEPVRWALGWS